MVYFYRKKEVRRLHFLLFVLWFCSVAITGHAAAKSDTLKVFSGKVISSIDGEPVPFAHIVNLTRGFGTTADNFGIFRIGAADKDSLYISSIGFTHSRLKLFILSWTDTEIIPFYLSPVAYEIKAVVVQRWRDFEDFKHDFLALKLPDTKTQRLSAYLTTITKEAAYSVPQSSGIAFGEDWYHQQKRKLNEYLVASGRKRMADEKLSPTTIMREVHCSEKYACEFLLWLNADTEYVLATKEYDLLVYVKEKYATWCKIFNRC